MKPAGKKAAPATIEALLGKRFELLLEPDDEPIQFQVVGYEPESSPAWRGAFFRVRCLNRVPKQQPIALLIMIAALRSGALKEI